MNRIERRVAGAGGPLPGAAVCDPGRPNNNIHRGMLGGGLLSRRMNTSNISNRRNRIVSNQISGLNTLKNEDNKITRIEKKLEELEHHSIINISEIERRIIYTEDKLTSFTDSYNKTMTSMKQYIKELQKKIINLEEPRVVVVAKKIEKSIENNVTNKITLKIQEKEVPIDS